MKETDENSSSRSSNDLGHLCFGSLSFTLLLLMFKLTVEVRNKSPKRENKRDAFLGFKLLLVENDGQDLGHRE